MRLARSGHRRAPLCYPAPVPTNPQDLLAAAEAHGMRPDRLGALFALVPIADDRCTCVHFALHRDGGPLTADVAAVIGEALVAGTASVGAPWRVVIPLSAISGVRYFPPDDSGETRLRLRAGELHHELKSHRRDPIPGDLRALADTLMWNLIGGS